MNKITHTRWKRFSGHLRGYWELALAVVLLAGAVAIFLYWIVGLMFSVRDYTLAYVDAVPSQAVIDNCSKKGEGCKSLQPFCHDMSWLCRSTLVPNAASAGETVKVWIPTCNDMTCHDTLDKVFQSTKPDIEAALALLNGYFIALCLALGYIYKRSIDSGSLQIRFSEGVALTLFFLSGYCVIFFTYWSRVAMIRQVGEVIGLPRIPHIVELTQRLAASTMMTAFCTISIILLVYFGRKDESDDTFPW